jgi:dynein heavy chain
VQFDQWKNSPHFSVVHYDSKTTPMGQVTVPTPETCSVVFWMEQMVAQRDPVMLVGYAGCGKTQLISGLLAQQKPEKIVSHGERRGKRGESRCVRNCTLTETPPTGPLPQ